MAESDWRTSIALVEGIVEVDSQIVGDDGSGLSPFIDTANALVTELCLNSGYQPATLELIERWLSAHFYSIIDPQAASEGAEGVSISYQQSVSLNLNQTRWGQQAMLVDYKGNLAALQKRVTEGIAPIPGVIWLGRRKRGWNGGRPCL